MTAELDKNIEEIVVPHARFVERLVCRDTCVF
jgi:hypothetical protein